MKVGVTGANGFIGNHLVRYLTSMGHEVIAFLQEGTSDALIKRHADDIFWGDITERHCLDPFVKKCDVLFHLAGYNRYWAKDPRTFFRINHLGARNVAAACHDHGIEKLVHVSSCVTLGASREPILRNESSEFNLQGVRFLYAESKKAGEEEMKEWAERKGLPVVIVHPASAIGEMDYGPTPIGKPIVDICRGFWPVYVSGGACFIDIHDLICGLWLALEKGRNGEQYLLVGENLSNRAFMAKVASLAGRRLPRMRVPKPILKVVAHCGEWLADHVTQQDPPLTVGMNALIGKYLYFDGAKSKVELGFESGACDRAIERSICWFRENGYVSS